MLQNTQKYKINNSLYERVAKTRGALIEQGHYTDDNQIMNAIVRKEFRMMFGEAMNASVLAKITEFTTQDPLTNKEFERTHSFPGFADDSEAGVRPSTVSFSKEKLKMLYETLAKAGYYFDRSLITKFGTDQWSYIVNLVARSIMNSFEKKIIQKYTHFDMRESFSKLYTANDKIDYQRLINHEKKLYNILGTDNGVGKLEDMVNNTINPFGDKKFIAIMPYSLRTVLVENSSKTLRREIHSVSNREMTHKRGVNLKENILETDLTTIHFIHNIKTSTKQTNVYNPCNHLGMIGEYYSAHNRMLYTPKAYVSDELAISLYDHSNKSWSKISPYTMVENLPWWDKNGNPISLGEIDAFGVGSEKKKKYDLLTRKGDGGNVKALIGELLLKTEPQLLKKLTETVVRGIKVPKIADALNYLIKSVEKLRNEKAAVVAPLKLEQGDFSFTNFHGNIAIPLFGWGSLWGLRFLMGDDNTSDTRTKDDDTGYIDVLGLDFEEFNKHYKVYTTFVDTYKEITPDNEIWAQKEKMKANGLSGMTDYDIFWVNFIWNTSDFMYVLTAGAGELPIGKDVKSKTNNDTSTESNDDNGDDGDDNDNGDDNGDDGDDIDYDDNDDNNNTLFNNISKEKIGVQLTKETAEKFKYKIDGTGDKLTNTKKWRKTAFVFSSASVKLATLADGVKVAGNVNTSYITIMPPKTELYVNAITYKPEGFGEILKDIPIQEFSKKINLKKMLAYDLLQYDTVSTNPVNSNDDWFFSGKKTSSNGKVLPNQQKKAIFAMEEKVEDFCSRYDVLSGVVFRAYCSIMLNKTSFLNLLKYNIFLPIELSVYRPHIRVKASSACFTLPKSSITHVRSSTVNQGNDTVKSRETYIVRYEIGCAIFNTDDVFSAPNAYSVRTENIGNEFFSPIKQINSINGGGSGKAYYSIKHRKYGTGRESLFSVAGTFGMGSKDLNNKNMTGVYQYYKDTNMNQKWKNVNLVRTMVMYGMKPEYGITNSRRTIDDWNPSKVNFSVALGKYARRNPHTGNMSTLINGDSFLKEKYPTQQF